MLEIAVSHGGNEAIGLGAGFGLLAVPIGLLCLREVLRRRRIRAWATSRGWRYEPSSLRVLDDFPGQPFDVTGGRSKVVAVVRGRLRDRRVVAFDYRHTYGSRGQHAETHRYVVIAVHLGLLPGLDAERHYSDTVVTNKVNAVLATTNLQQRTHHGWLVLWDDGLNRARELDERIGIIDAALAEIPLDVQARLGWQTGQTRYGA